MISYVLGFCFDPSLELLALIKKNRPPEMAGKWNGVGGNVEKNEPLGRAMEREFEEEAGAFIPANRWHLFAVANDCAFFWVTSIHCQLVESKTQEEICVKNITEWLNRDDLVPDLYNYIPTALKEAREMARG